MNRSYNEVKKQCEDVGVACILTLMNGGLITQIDPSTSCSVRITEGNSGISYREKVRERRLAGVVHC